MSDDDREAVRRVQAGDTEAFEPLVEKYKTKTFRLAFGVLRDQEEALDVAQEAFVKAFRSLPKFKGDSAFYTWLFRITMNLALDRRRQRATRAKALGAGDVPPEEWERTAVSPERGPDDEAAGAERRARIGRALESLSENHRSIIMLSDIEGLTYREIAEVLGVPMGTVMSRLHNARRRLRDALGPGFMGVLLSFLLVSSVFAQGPPPGMPPPRGTPGQSAPGMPRGAAAHVCVYALVLLASHQPSESPGSRLTPTPPLRSPEAPRSAPPEAQDWGPALPGTGCGEPLRLRPWVPRLHEVFGYASFEPVSAFETIMALGLSHRFALPGGRELDIQALAIRPPVVRLAVRIIRGGLTEIATVMDVPARRPALIGGPPHGPGVLIIAIRARIEP